MVCLFREKMKNDLGKLARRAVVVSAALVAIGCGGGGGGGGGTSPPPPFQASGAQGGWTGTLGTGVTYNLFVLDDSSFWLFYDTAAGSNNVRGLMQGAGAVNGANLNVTALKNFDFVSDTSVDGAFAGSFTTRTAINGLLTFPSAPMQNTSVGTGAFASVYETTPVVVANIAGTYPSVTLRRIGPETTANIAISNVAGVGTFVMNITGGCIITGTVTPRPTGNVFVLNGQWGAAPCNPANTAFSGHIFLLPPNQLTVWWVDAARANAYVASGIRQ